VKQRKKGKSRKGRIGLFWKIIIAVVVGFVLFAAIGLSLVFLDTAGSMATSTQSFGPTGYSVNSQAANATVIYDPGLTGATKGIAEKITTDLQAQGYWVDLAGIKSTTATGNLSQYQVIVVGGPIYGGKASSSVQSFLSSLKPANGTEIGVFGVGMLSSSNDQVAPMPSDSTFTIKETLKITTSQDAATMSNEFVNQLLG
jgi:flavodoxin